MHTEPRFQVDSNVKALAGAHDEDPNTGQKRFVHVGDTGRVISVDYYPRQGWTYGVVFPSGAWVFYDDHDINQLEAI